MDKSIDTDHTFMSRLGALLKRQVDADSVPLYSSDRDVANALRDQARDALIAYLDRNYMRRGSLPTAPGR